jgi:hypothetical protein
MNKSCQTDLEYALIVPAIVIEEPPDDDTNCECCCLGLYYTLVGGLTVLLFHFALGII